MRVLYFSRDYTSHDHRFLNALAESGHEIYSARLERRGSPLEDRLLPANVKQVVWEGGTKPVPRGEYPLYARHFQHVLEQIRPDVVHAGPVQDAALVAAMAGADPLVTMSWGYDMLVDARRTQALEADTRFVIQRSSMMVVDCDAVKKAVSGFGFDVPRVVQFPWGVDLNHFQPEPLRICRKQFGWPEERFVVLSLRAWEPIYDVATIVEGFIQAVRVDPSLYLVLLGGGSQRDQLQQRLTEAGVMETVLFGGRIAYQQLPCYYQAADLYASASLTDGSSVSLLEAFACGTPALVSDIPGNREWLDEGGEGWFFPVGDANMVAEKILLAAGNRSQLPNMGHLARKRVERYANWKENFPKLIQAYEMAIQYQRSLP